MTRAQREELHRLARQPYGVLYEPSYAYPSRHYDALEQEGLVTIDRRFFQRYVALTAAGVRATRDTGGEVHRLAGPKRAADGAAGPPAA